MPTEEKKKRVYEIIDALDMRKCLHTGMFTSLSLRGWEFPYKAFSSNNIIVRQESMQL